MKIAFAKPAVPTQGCAVVTLAQGAKLSGAAAALDKRTKGAITRAIAASGFVPAREKTLVIAAPAGTKLTKIVVLGLGDAGTVDAKTAEKLGAIAYDHAARETACALLIDGGNGKKIGSGAKGTAGGAATAPAHMACGAALKSYRFDKYRTKEDKDAKPKIKALTIHSDAAPEAKRLYGPLAALVEGVMFTRDLVSEPANVLYPASFVERCLPLKKDGLQIEVLSAKDMARLGMGALLGVGQGSMRESKLLVMRWLGARDKTAKPLALVGKGVCFDTGGISLKNPPGMWDMKWDMAGAGAVAGTMAALAKRKARVNVVGLCGLVENMPDANAQRPGDVVTSMSGQTIEVQNTDAEGRLVLADVLWYAQEKYQPRAIVDLATLTGAIIAALSEFYGGLFSNDDDLANRLFKAGQDSGERLWRFPMGEEYDKDLKSLIADMKNIGGGKAGSITAAQFLQRFIKDTPWAHLDIAGTVWTEKGTALSAPGATGYGVRLLNKFIAENYEG